MFDRFTDRARRIIVLAQEAARQNRSRAITSEHLFLAIAWEGESVAAAFLLQAGLPADRIDAALEPDPEPTAMGVHIPFTPGTKVALDESLREALKLGHNYIGPEHLLLALLSNAQRADISGLFERLELNAQATYAQFLRHLMQVSADTPPPPEYQTLPGTQLRYIDVLGILGRVIESNRRLLAIELIKVQPDTAPAAAGIVDGLCRSIGAPSPSLSLCIHNVTDLSKLVKLLNQINALQQVDPTLPKTVHLLVQHCAREYRRWVLGQS